MGDGTRETIIAHNQAEKTHQYASTGIYEIRIIGGLTGWYFAGGGDDDKIIDISNWGPIDLKLSNVFNGCSNLDITATDGPKVELNNFSSMFANCPKLTNIGSWDTSSATSMYHMFYGCTGFNQPIGNWDTSKVTDMSQMLYGCNSFNQDLGGWDVTGVTDLSNFFSNNPVFNNGGSTGINNWRPSSCTTMRSMFEKCYNFNQPIGD